jgi:hypothetical protein
LNDLQAGRDRETYLKEVLDELNLDQTIIKILQNELLSSKVSVTMCAEDQFHTERLSSKPDMGIRTSAIPKNNTVKALKD